MSRTALLLVRGGAALVGLAVLFSFWASPDRMRSLVPFLLALVGVSLVLVCTSQALPALSRRIRPVHIAAFFLYVNLLALPVTIFTSRWPHFKLAWLNALYAALPTMRSLPFSWAAEGLSPNQTGGILAVCTAFSVALALGLRRTSYGRYRWLAVFLSVVGYVTVFMTGSRAALAALAVATLMIALIYTARWLWAWGAALAVAVVGLLASGRLIELVRLFLRDETLDTKLVARLDIWSSTLKGIEDHLFTGIGLNVFNQVMPTRYPYQSVGLSYAVSQAHNLFLDVTLAIGLPGLIGLLAVFAGAIMLAVKGAKSPPFPRAISLGILGSIVAFLIFGVTDSISLAIPTSFIIWIWVVALVILNSQRDETVDHSGR